jgi:hypothetical protein
MKRLLIPLFALFVLTAASARVDYISITPERTAVLPGGIMPVSATLRNTGNDHEYFFVRYNVAGAEYKTGLWHLEPREQGNFTVYFQAPEKEGIYQAKMLISNDRFAAEPTFDLIVAPTEFNFVSELKPDYINIEVGEDAVIDLVIANVGSKTDVYGIVVEQDVKSSSNTVELDQNEVGHIELVKKTYISDDSGATQVDVRVCSLTLWECQDISSTVVLTKSESLQSLISIDMLNITTFSGTGVFTISVTNIGNEEKPYLIEVETDENTTALFNGSFTVLPRETKAVRLALSTDQLGAHFADVKVFANGVEIVQGDLKLNSQQAGLVGAFVAVTTNAWLYGIIALVFVSVVAVFLLWPGRKTPKKKSPYEKEVKKAVSDFMVASDVTQPRETREGAENRFDDFMRRLG